MWSTNSETVGPLIQEAMSNTNPSLCHCRALRSRTFLLRTVTNSNMADGRKIRHNRH